MLYFGFFIHLSVVQSDMKDRLMIYVNMFVIFRRSLTPHENLPVYHTVFHDIVINVFILYQNYQSPMCNCNSVQHLSGSTLLALLH